MFDSGGSSGQLRDELGVLPPGDVLKCALALARNEGEARRVLLAAPADARAARPAGRSHRRQPAAVDDGAVQRRLPRRGGRPARAARLPRPRLAGQRAAGHALCGVRRRHERARRGGRRCRTVGAAMQVQRLWLEPDVAIHPAVAGAIREFDAVIIGPGSFFTSLMPPLLVRGVREALAEVRGPIILIANLLTEGRGMNGFTAADAARWVADAIDRPVDVRHRQHRAAVERVAAALRRGTQGAARTGTTQRRDGAGARALLVHRDRAARSAPAVVRGVVGAEPAAAQRADTGRTAGGVGGHLNAQCPMLNAQCSMLNAQCGNRESGIGNGEWGMGKSSRRKALDRCRANG